MAQRTEEQKRTEIPGWRKDAETGGRDERKERNKRKDSAGNGRGAKTDGFAELAMERTHAAARQPRARTLDRK
jgi:hypothetical protein